MCPMANLHSNQRSSPRVLIVCPISIELESGTVHGIVRDISAGGIFFYSNFRPALNTEVDFVMRMKGKNVHGRGKIVRVQEGTPGAAIGVALKLAEPDQPRHSENLLNNL